MIHPAAVIHSRAEVDSSAIIGPYAVVDAEVVIGPGCEIGPHVYITGHTMIGANNRFHAGCVIGDAPQDLKYKGQPTVLQIGAHNIFREHVTIHRSNQVEEGTLIGNHNFFMANSHVGHNTRVGDNVIIANGALLGGHVIVEDRVFISGNCLVHQFVRIGTLALMQGGAAVSKDLPPFTVARGDNTICGLNTIGLRRAGISPAKRLELKSLYHQLFLRGLNLRATLAEARGKFTGKFATQLISFIEASKRGVCHSRFKAETERDQAL